MICETRASARLGKAAWGGGGFTWWGGSYRVKTMETKSQLWNLVYNRFRRAHSLGSCAGGKGQALVEFTLCFILLLIIAWIPADFGLAFYTAQLAQSASREGARIAAADRAPVDGSCTMPCSSATGILRLTADRMAAGLLPGATVTLAVDPGATCDRLVTVTISGQYRYWFYQILRLMGFNVPNTVTITRQTSMRWEHQC